MRGFFDPADLGETGQRVEHIWERDSDGGDRDWLGGRGYGEPMGRKRWLVVAIFRRVRREEGRKEQRRRRHKHIPTSLTQAEALRGSAADG